MFWKNRITLIGFIGKDAQTCYTPSGTAYTQFSLATKESWKDKATDTYQTRVGEHPLAGSAGTAPCREKMAPRRVTRTAPKRAR